MSLLTISCTICGFYTTDIKNHRIRKIVICYCYTLAMTFLFIPLIVLVQEISLLEYNMFSALYFLMHIVGTTLLTYYRIKCVRERTVTSDIFKMFNYIDESLKRDVGVKIPHARNQILCTLYTVFIILLSAVVSFIFVPEDNRLKSIFIMGEIYYGCSILDKYLAFHSTILLSTQLTFLLYLIKQRIELLNCATLRIVKRLVKRKIAWNNRVGCVSVCGTLGKAEALRKLQVHYRKLLFMYGCINAAYDGIKRMYTEFVCLKLVTAILVISIDVLFSVLTQTPGVYYIFLAILTLSLDVSPILLCENIRKASLYAEALFRQIYCNIRFKLDNENTMKYTYQCTHEEQTFDCGYFEVDSNLLLLLYNFISLFIISNL